LFDVFWTGESTVKAISWTESSYRMRDLRPINVDSETFRHSGVKVGESSKPFLAEIGLKNEIFIGGLSSIMGVKSPDWNTQSSITSYS